MIQIIDYEAGNIRSVENALEKIGCNYEVITKPEQLRNDSKIIFPGVGSAGSAKKNLKQGGFVSAIRKLKNPFLGICLGMQLLFDYSEENDTTCLGIIEGCVKRLPMKVKVPQIGWNQVGQTKKDELFAEIEDSNYFYFVNSYVVKTAPKYVLGKTDYGIPFASVIRKDNFYGTQFHPEKSGDVGLKLLANFCKKC